MLCGCAPFLVAVISLKLFWELLYVIKQDNLSLLGQVLVHMKTMGCFPAQLVACFGVPLRTGHLPWHRLRQNCMDSSNSGVCVCVRVLHQGTLIMVVVGKHFTFLLIVV